MDGKQKGICRRKKALAMLIGLMMILFVIISSVGCTLPYRFSKATPNPKLNWDVFNSIGRQGIREKTTLDELQGDYKGKLLNAIPADPQSITTLSVDDIRLIEWLSDGEMDIRGKIEGSELALTVILPNGDFLDLDELPPFELEKGILTAPVTTQVYTDDTFFDMICMVKVYPESLMVDGILRQEIQMSDNKRIKMIFHFQVINER